MKTKIAGKLFLAVLILSTISLGINIRSAQANPSIVINPDGSVTPSTAPVLRSGSLYLFTADIYDSIEIHKDNIVVDGNSFKLQGSSAGTGFTTQNVNNVTVINAKVSGFAIGVYFLLGSGSVKASMLTNNGIGIEVVDSSHCAVIGSNVSYNSNMGIYLFSSVTSSVVSGNSIEYNGVGVAAVSIYSISGNNITENSIAHNSIGLKIDNSGGTVADNLIYHNNFIDNTQQINYIPVLPGTYFFGNIWDNGYPSGGNFWSDYTGVDFYSGPSQNIPGSDGIGDTPYVITPKDMDHYPLMVPYNTAEYFVLLISTTAGGTTNPVPGSHIYAHGEVAMIEALPEAIYFFDHWELDSINTGISNPISVTMNANHALKAVFKAQPDIAVTSVLAYPTSVRLGQIVYINVTVANYGLSNETFDVIVYADRDRKTIGDEVTVGAQTVTNLLSGGTRTITFVWDTSKLTSGGNFYISAKAIVPYDLNPNNNLLIAKKKVTIR